MSNPHFSQALPLRRDDETDPHGRIYWDDADNRYYSVTRILKGTSDSAEALKAWAERQDAIYGPGAALQDRDTAAERGTRAHHAAEYVLRNARLMAKRQAEAKRLWRAGADGLERGPASCTQWAIRRSIASAPKGGLSAAGYSRSLTQWIGGNVTAIHAVEFSLHHPLGYAGTCDALVDVGGRLTLADWKTSFIRRKEALIRDYEDQLGAYAMALELRYGVRVKGGTIVIARRVGPADVFRLDRRQLDRASARFEKRVGEFLERVAAGDEV